MSNLHRIVWLDSGIRSERYPDSRDLAERFEISVRQAQRDIEYLKYTMGAPLEYSSMKKGYYYKDKAFILPSAMISDEEKQMLSYMANRYKIAGGTDARKLAGLFERLVSGDDGSDTDTIFHTLPVLQIKQDEVKNYNILCEALKKKIKVEMTYGNNEGELSKRIFRAYAIFNRNQCAYVTGFCERREEIRVFRISRIQKLDILEETYEIPSNYNEDYFGTGKDFFFREPYTAVLEMEQPPEHTAIFLKMERLDGRLYKFYFYSSDEIINFLLSNKNPFKIISPNWLKDKLHQRLEKIIRTNFDSDNICRTSPL